MPYGGWGGLADGFGKGLGFGAQIGEVRMRREALQQEQIKENVGLMTGYINEGLKNLSEIVTKSPQRDPKLESIIQNYQAQLTEAAQTMQKLGPQGEQAAKMSMQTINNIIPRLQTQSEAFSAKRTGEVTGAFDAANSFAGAQAPAPTTGPAPQPTGADTQTVANPGTPGLPTAADPTVPTELGSGTSVAQNMANKFGYSEKQLFEMMLTGKPPETSEEEKISQEAPGRLAIMQTGLTQLEDKVSEDDDRTNRELLADPKSWNMMQAIGVPSRLAGSALPKAQDAAKAVVRGAFYNLTGASAPASEEAQLFDLFIPAWGDDKERAQAKLDRLYEFAGRAQKMVTTRKGTKIGREEAMLLAGMPADAVYREGPAPEGTQQQEASSGMGSSATAAPSGGPKPGDVEDGYRFKGGNPADPNAWEKVQ